MHTLQFPLSTHAGTSRPSRATCHNASPARQPIQRCVVRAAGEEVHMWRRTCTCGGAHVHEEVHMYMAQCLQLQRCQTLVVRPSKAVTLFSKHMPAPSAAAVSPCHCTLQLPPHTPACPSPCVLFQTRTVRHLLLPGRCSAHFHCRGGCSCCLLLPHGFSRVWGCPCRAAGGFTHPWRCTDTRQASRMTNLHTV